MSSPMESRKDVVLAIARMTNDNAIHGNADKRSPLETGVDNTAIDALMDKDASKDNPSDKKSSFMEDSTTASYCSHGSDKKFVQGKSNLPVIQKSSSLNTNDINDSEEGRNPDTLVGRKHKDRNNDEEKDQWSSCVDNKSKHNSSDGTSSRAVKHFIDTIDWKPVENPHTLDNAGNLETSKALSSEKDITGSFGSFRGWLKALSRRKPHNSSRYPPGVQNLEKLNSNVKSERNSAFNSINKSNDYTAHSQGTLNPIDAIIDKAGLNSSNGENNVNGIDIYLKSATNNCNTVEKKDGINSSKYNNNNNNNNIIINDNNSCDSVKKAIDFTLKFDASSFAGHDSSAANPSLIDYDNPSTIGLSVFSSSNLSSFKYSSLSSSSLPNFTAQPSFFSPCNANDRNNNDHGEANLEKDALAEDFIAKNNASIANTDLIIANGLMDANAAVEESGADATLAPKSGHAINLGNFASGDDHNIDMDAEDVHSSLQEGMPRNEATAFINRPNTIIDINISVEPAPFPDLGLAVNSSEITVNNTMDAVTTPPHAVNRSENSNRSIINASLTGENASQNASQNIHVHVTSSLHDNVVPMGDNGSGGDEENTLLAENTENGGTVDSSVQHDYGMQVVPLASSMETSMKLIEKSPDTEFVFSDMPGVCIDADDVFLNLERPNRTRGTQNRSTHRRLQHIGTFKKPIVANQNSTDGNQTNVKPNQDQSQATIHDQGLDVLGVASAADANTLKNVERDNMMENRGSLANITEQDMYRCDHDEDNDDLQKNIDDEVPDSQYKYNLGTNKDNDCIESNNAKDADGDSGGNTNIDQNKEKKNYVRERWIGRFIGNPGRTSKPLSNYESFEIKESFLYTSKPIYAQKNAKLDLFQTPCSRTSSASNNEVSAIQSIDRFFSKMETMEDDHAPKLSIVPSCSDGTKNHSNIDHIIRSSFNGCNANATNDIIYDKQGGKDDIDDGKDDNKIHRHKDIVENSNNNCIKKDSSLFLNSKLCTEGSYKINEFNPISDVKGGDYNIPFSTLFSTLQKKNTGEAMQFGFTDPQHTLKMKHLRKWRLDAAEWRTKLIEEEKTILALSYPFPSLSSFPPSSRVSLLSPGVTECNLMLSLRSHDSDSFSRSNLQPMCCFCGSMGHTLIQCSETKDCELSILKSRLPIFESLLNSFDCGAEKKSENKKVAFLQNVSHRNHRYHSSSLSSPLVSSTAILCLRCLERGHWGSECFLSVTEAFAKVKRREEDGEKGEAKEKEETSMVDDNKAKSKRKGFNGKNDMHKDDNKDEEGKRKEMEEKKSNERTASENSSLNKSLHFLNLQCSSPSPHHNEYQFHHNHSYHSTTSFSLNSNHTASLPPLPPFLQPEIKELLDDLSNGCKSSNYSSSSPSFQENEIGDAEDERMKKRKRDLISKSLDEHVSSCYNNMINNDDDDKPIDENVDNGKAEREKRKVEEMEKERIIISKGQRKSEIFMENADDNVENPLTRLPEDVIRAERSTFGSPSLKQTNNSNRETGEVNFNGQKVSNHFHPSFPSLLPTTIPSFSSPYISSSLSFHSEKPFSSFPISSSSSSSLTQQLSSTQFHSPFSTFLSSYTLKPCPSSSAQQSSSSSHQPSASTPSAQQLSTSAHQPSLFPALSSFTQQPSLLSSASFVFSQPLFSSSPSPCLSSSLPPLKTKDFFSHSFLSSSRNSSSQSIHTSTSTATTVANKFFSFVANKAPQLNRRETRDLNKNEGFAINSSSSLSFTPDISHFISNSNMSNVAHASSSRPSLSTDFSNCNDDCGDNVGDAHEDIGDHHSSGDYDYEDRRKKVYYNNLKKPPFLSPASVFLKFSNFLPTFESLRLSRKELFKCAEHSDFESKVNGFFLRLKFGKNPNSKKNKSGYRMARICGAASKKMYNTDTMCITLSVEFAGNEYNVEAQYISNKPFTKDELFVWWNLSTPHEKHFLSSDSELNELMLKRTHFSSI